MSLFASYCLRARSGRQRGQVHRNQSELAAALYELIRLRDELHVLDPRVLVHEQAPVASHTMAASALHVAALRMLPPLRPTALSRLAYASLKVYRLQPVLHALSTVVRFTCYPIQ